MAGVLSERQKDELHRSMLDYLFHAGLSETYEALKQEARLTDFDPNVKGKTSGLLERKWLSVIRLQKKVMDLESKNSQLTEELSTSRLNPAMMRNSIDWVPRGAARHTLTGHRATINCVAFHPLYNTCASASEDSSIKIWDWETGEFERTLKGHTKAVQDCDYDSKGQWLISCSSDLSIKLWDVPNDYSASKTFHGHDHSISSIRFLPDDERFASASRDQSIRIWEVATGHCVKTLSGHTEWVRAVAPSPDSRYLLSCSNDQSARLWDLATGETKLQLRGHDNVVECAVFAPAICTAAIRELAGLPNTDRDTRDRSNASLFVATGSRDKTIQIWDITTGQSLRTLSGHDNWIRALVFHPNGKMLLSASDDKTVRVWDLATGRCTKTIEAHSHFVTCMAWGRVAIPAPVTQNGINGADAQKAEPRMVNVIATGSVDQTIKIWLP